MDGQEHDREIERASTTDGLPISPSFGPALFSADVPRQTTPVDVRVLYISALAIAVGLVGAFVAEALIAFIRFLTNLCFLGHLTLANIDRPLSAGMRPWIIFVPVAGAIVIGWMARYGHRAVAGHGIPEAMEQVLTNQSRIPPRLTFLKPLSAAISIGTGAPYGAEGPIIATGGALGSLLGQILHVTADERKILLSAGASAGIAAAFNAPIAAVLLAVELLLFEFRARSLIPVILACVAAAAVHIAFDGAEPLFRFSPNVIAAPSQSAVLLYLAIGAIVGVASVILTKAVYATEHFFEHLPIHWMWHPAIGAIAVGVIGYYYPRTFGSGYYNIRDMISLDPSRQSGIALSVVMMLGLMKFLSWTISLGSGTAGGTLAPVFTIGGTIGAALGFACQHYLPHSGLNVGMAALVGMVGIFAGASRALLTSVVFAVETTMEPRAILPSLAGCTMAYLISSLLMRHSIMTLKMATRGVRVPDAYHPDFLDSIPVSQVMTPNPIMLNGEDAVAKIRKWIYAGGKEASHQGFPVINTERFLLGVVTRRDILDPQAPDDRKICDMIHRRPSIVYDDCTLRDAADHMVRHDVGRLPVVSRSEPWKVVGIITRSDVLGAHRTRIAESECRSSGSLIPVGETAG